MSRSYMTGAARMDLSPSQRQASASTRLSDSVSSQRSGRASFMHSPLNPELISTCAPIGGAVVPATARHVMPFSPAMATAAPVPLVIEQAGLAISLSAALMSLPKDWNSYCAVVDVTGFLGMQGEASGSASRLSATPLAECPLPLPPLARNAESLTTHRGAFQLGVPAFWVSQ